VPSSSWAWPLVAALLLATRPAPAVWGVSCWSGAFKALREDCCDTEKHGSREGNSPCWEGAFQFEACCQETEDVTNRGLGNLDRDFTEDCAEADHLDKVEETLLQVSDGQLKEQLLNRAQFVGAHPQVRFDFHRQVHHLHSAARAESVLIFVHEVPPCAGHGLLQEFLVNAGRAEDRSSWGNVLQEQAEHLRALDSAVRNSGALTTDPQEATLFYVPAFWSLLIEKFIDLYGHHTRQDADKAAVFAEMKHTGLECVSATFDRLKKNDYYTRNAAYDHFWVAGVQHPLNSFPSSVCQMESYDPFAKNMMILASGVRDFGFSDPLFEWGAPLYGNLQHIFVPYSTRLHCRHLEALAKSPRKRPVAVAFVGSPSSKVRHWVQELASEADFASDARLVLRFASRVEDVQAASRGGSKADDVHPEAAGATNLTRLYQEADFCLCLPGHLHVLTKRCFDAMAQGCLPVVVTKYRFWIALPFAAQAPWSEFATFRRVASAGDLRKVLEELLARHEEQTGLQQRRLALSRAVGLFAVHDEHGCTDDERSAFTAYLLEEFRARQRIWPHIRSSWLFPE
ncbi:unnamed protein product, partial [Polarella glacialis]